MKLGESDWEQLTLEVLAELGWTPLPGAAIAPGASAVVGRGSEPEAQRPGWDEVLIPSRLRAALRRLNPDVPREYLDQALATIASPTSQDAITENKRIHDYLVGGFRGISYIDDDGRERTPTIRLFSLQPDENEWLAVNQVTVVRGEVERRFDVVLYVNGMPLAVLELKRAGSASADVASAQAQIATYVRELPMAFRFCAATVVSDGVLARYGTPFTPFNHYAPWNVDEDGKPVDLAGQSLDPAVATDGITGSTADEEDATSSDVVTRLELTLHGLFNQERFGQLVHDFVAFDENADGLTKRIAKPHQYFAVQKAVGTTVQAAQSNGRAGVVWHTQGSGKSMEMELYANRVLRHPLLRNPTIVVVTDRTELDGQLYQTFAQSQLLPEQPRQVRRRDELRDELSQRGSGGIYFTTLQKFGLSKAEKDAGLAHPLLSDRHNIVVVVDEAHRSHYDNLDGYAWHLKNALPHATLIAFTGTPISFVDRNTRDVFGDYIDVYDLTRAVEDGATVPVYFESRLVKVGFAEGLDDEAIDEAADEATAGLDDTERDRIERSVAVVNAIYGAPARLKALAADLVEHWESRREAMFELLGTPDRPATPGKALVVGATRRICADLYAEIVGLRPDWHSEDLSAGRIKVVYSGEAADRPPVSEHVRRDSENAVIKQRLKDPDDELELVIVKDMMLTGFDAPPLHTLYLDRPIKGALLMQTLARVNRTFRGKNAGLLVAYAPVAENLASALAEYTVTDRDVRPVGRPVEAAEGAVRELLAEIEKLLAGFGWRSRLGADEARAYVRAVHATVNWLRSPATPAVPRPDGEPEPRGVVYRRLAARLSRAWAIAGRAEALGEVEADARFFEEVRVWMGKFDAEDRQARGEPVPDDVQRLLNKLVGEAVVSGEVVDIYRAAGLEPPSLDRLDAEYVARAQASENPQLAIEALRKTILEGARGVSRHNLVRQRAFAERLAEVMNRYTNLQLTSAEVIAALVEMAREVAAESDRGQRFSPPLDDDELAFYDAVASNESAVEVQGEEVLAKIARELVAVVRRDVKTDWTVRDDVRAKLRSSIKRLLVKYDYPPDKRDGAIKLVMDQMEAMAPRLAA